MPRELRLEIRPRPSRGSFLQLAHEVGEAVRGLQADEQMDVVGHAADLLADATKPVDGASEILMQTGTPFRADRWPSVFCRKDEVVMEA